MKVNEELQLKYKSLFNSRVGKDVLDDLLKFSQFDDNEFCSDSNALHFKQGRKNVIAYIIQFLERKHLKDKPATIDGSKILDE